VPEVPEVLRVEGGVAGERTTATPLPNRTDAAFDELAQLRREAGDLGLGGADRLPLTDLRAAVERARAERG
jgi:hypothetical protein